MQMPERARRCWCWIRAVPPWAVDALVATVLLVLALLTVNEQLGHEMGYEPLDARAYLLILAVIVPYYARSRAPVAVFVLSAMALVVYASLGYQLGSLPTVLLVGVYTVGAYRPPRLVAATYGVVLVSLTLFAALDVRYFSSSTFVQMATLFAFSLLFGWTVQSRRLRLAEADERARLLEREQAEEAARAVADERLRIAQELHDVVAHSMSVIAVQAGVGLHVADADPAEAKTALQHISDTSRSTLVELRRLLGVLRDEGSGLAYAPAPGLAELDRLTHDVGGAGLPVELHTEGVLADVPPGVGFTGYRIVQEALTNVLKHAGPARASVHVVHTPGTLRIEVSDDGRGVNGRSPTGGHGLPGMRERVAVYGGTLTAGPQPGGGYLVTAVLPYGTYESEEA